jgi:subfamily B ATP-binding cassette protein HlyB/CyaB
LSGKNHEITLDILSQHWNGTVVQMVSRANLTGNIARFDFSWFIPPLIKHRKLLGEVLLVSFVMQLLALITPLFFQVVMDKVLVHRALTTLQVIAIGLLAVSLFQVVLGGIRSYIFSHTTLRIDVELGAKLFKHMLRLPLSYFEQRKVGDSIARVRELENIRSFLTGNAVTLVLDLLFSVVFIAVMLIYSVKLTIIVLLSIPCYAILTIAITPILRRRLNDKFAKSSANQSFLVESLSNIQTVKAMALEPQMSNHWEQQLASYVHSSFKTTTVGMLGSQGVSLVNQLVTVAIMWIGASLVIGDKLTVGQLVAFNMLSGQVASPVMRLAQLWQDFQQTGISVARLGDILNTASENENVTTSVMPEIIGAINFEQVRFRYSSDGRPVLNNVDLKINAGEIIGIVGRSGSGKSTLSKILQRLYIPEHGRISIDGIDLSLANPAWLRRQIGVVLQENNLFNRSIRDNIAISNKNLPLDAVINAAKLAGAHDFIVELPQGYDTILGEHGTGLSGGQRQRIAIARALINNPRILIFDEATSALDYESERIIQDNMQQICAGRTVLIIAHRLSAVRIAHRIIAMDHGEIVECGSHNELMALNDGYYRYLHSLQG